MNVDYLLNTIEAYLMNTIGCHYTVHT